MKRIVITLLICIIVVLGIRFITRTDILYTTLVKDIPIEDVYINDLQITNNTYYYERLTDSQKNIYRAIANGVMNLNTDIIVDVAKDSQYNNTKTEIEVALNAFLADHPEVFYINDTYEISFIDAIVIKKVTLKLSYISDSKEEINYMKQEISNEIEKINSKLTNVETDYEKELLIHDLLAANIDYYKYDDYNNIPNIKHTVYGALVQNSAVCDGITKAFQIVLSKNDIESVFVTGETEDVAHAWCKVKIGGDYYNVDLTSDKTINEINKSLVVHSYFNVTDTEILKTHLIDNNESMPSCISSKYNYYVYNDYMITHLDNFEYKLSKIIKKQEKRPLLEFNVSGITNTPEKMVQSLYDLDFNNFKKNNITKIEYNKINDNYIVVK